MSPGYTDKKYKLPLRTAKAVQLQKETYTFLLFPFTCCCRKYNCKDIKRYYNRNNNNPWNYRPYDHLLCQLRCFLSTRNITSVEFRFHWSSINYSYNPKNLTTKYSNQYRLYQPCFWRKILLRVGVIIEVSSMCSIIILIPRKYSAKQVIYTIFITNLNKIHLKSPYKIRIFVYFFTPSVWFTNE